MSFLSILLVASAFYLVHARPESQSWSELLAEKLINPEDSLAPVTNPKDYQFQLYGFMDKLTDTVDKYMTPLMANLDKNKQDELKSGTLNGFMSYVNYMLLLIEEIEKVDSQTQGDSYPRNEMTIQFGSPHQLDLYTPYLGETEGDDVTDEE